MAESNRKNWAGRVALVTGAASGNGKATARALAKLDMRVIGCDIDMDNLKKLAAELEAEGHKEKMACYRCDVTNEDDVVNMFRSIDAEHGGVDVLINNAGLTRDAPLLSGDVKSWNLMLQVNVIGVALVQREAVKSMLSKGIDDGHVVILSSMAGHRVANNANMHFYTASKHATTVLSEGLRNELNALQKKFRVTQISPGVVQTQFWHGMSGEKWFHDFQCLTSDDIANAIVYGLTAPSYVNVATVMIRPTGQRH